MNHYANKKSAAESMLDVALLMANASQLKTVLELGPTFSFYIPIISLISISLILQIIVGILLIFIGKRSSSKQRTHVLQATKYRDKNELIQDWICTLFLTKEQAFGT